MIRPNRIRRSATVRGARASAAGLAVALATVTAPGLTPAVAEEHALDGARAAVRAMREQSYLVTRCEAAFQEFWKAFRTPGADGLVYENDLFGGRRYYGFGNVGAEPLLSEATAVCRAQTGYRGDLVVAALTEREKKKEARRAHLKRTRDMVAGW